MGVAPGSLHDIPQTRYFLRDEPVGGMKNLFNSYTVQKLSNCLTVTFDTTLFFSLKGFSFVQELFQIASDFDEVIW